MNTDDQIVSAGVVTKRVHRRVEKKRDKIRSHANCNGKWERELNKKLAKLNFVPSLLKVIVMFISINHLTRYQYTSFCS